MEAENIESMDLESLKNLVEESIEDLVLEKMSSSLDRPIMSIAREVLLGGGKRYRPILVIMAYKAAGGSDYREALDLSLIHISEPTRPY